MEEGSNHSFLVFDFILFELIDKLKGERSITGIVRILKGSAAKQTLQDVHLFHVETFYGIFYLFSENEITRRIEFFLQKEYLSNIVNRLQIQEKGVRYLQWLRAQQLERTLPKIESVLLRNRKELFWKRLVLLIQTLSYFAYQKKRFVPIVADQEIKAWVKKYIKPLRQERLQKLIKQLRLELNQIRDHLNERDQQLLLYRLHGRHRSAFTWRQLESILQIPIAELKIRFSLTLLHIYLTICKEKNSYPIFSSLFDLQNETKILSKSTQYTLQLLKKGLTLKQIAIKRKLTIGTIYDHLMEIILQLPTQLKLENYIEKWKINQISEWYQQIGSYRLSDYKSLLNEAISYQDLRIVLAYYRAIESDSRC
ncbi:helix-turn-helix domain-containing protein [Tepidibacillus fermentans]|uniref:Uncharacterized protein YpbB n=1 Tax=Tepidibacillus fermentans TaxID=1281767 RepID=A0A4R3KL81_9BACI|nr:helix-turn-helix domain-containing protein [Tepidibacillus fermentans]TCS84106.1 uncharacterized protein YpbB [Tepidibacillus fermentans]